MSTITAKIMFFQVRVGQDFTMPCGAAYCKKSSRTAWADKDHPKAGHWFYFGKYEQVIVQVHPLEIANKGSN